MPRGAASCAINSSGKSNSKSETSTCRRYHAAELEGLVHTIRG